LKKEIIRMLIAVAEMMVANTTLPPKCQPKVLFIYHPHAKQSMDNTNHTAKLCSAKLNIWVFRKFEANISTPSNTGVK
jgi:hypothetical protein